MGVCLLCVREGQRMCGDWPASPFVCFPGPSVACLACEGTRGLQRQGRTAEGVRGANGGLCGFRAFDLALINDMAFEFE